MSFICSIFVSNNNIYKIMEKLELIKNALERGQSRGIFTLDEAAAIFNTLNGLAKQLTPQEEEAVKLPPKKRK